MKIEAAQAKDVAEVVALLEGAGLPPGQLVEHLEHFLVAREGDAVRGCAGMEVCGDSCLMRSLAVYPDCRGQGVGTLLVQALIAKAKHLGLRRAYAVTATAADFARRFGFAEVPRDEVDTGLSWQLEEEACWSATTMRLQLDS